ncbi:MAG: nucleotidyltransferase [Acidobacteria bacterium]|nr:nucleotidyltransferase [Acidobacteriota bacterium]
MNSDFRDLLQIFAAYKVRYLIIGGYAVSKHSEPRYTKDLDIWIDNSIENAELVYSALKAFGAPMSDVTVNDLTTPSMVYQIGIEPTRVDIIMGLAEMDFDNCWKRRESVSIGEIPMNFISLSDLIETKDLAGRPQDIIDADNLRRQLNEQN